MRLCPFLFKKINFQAPTTVHEYSQAGLEARVAQVVPSLQVPMINLGLQSLSLYLPGAVPSHPLEQATQVSARSIFPAEGKTTDSAPYPDFISCSERTGKKQNILKANGNKI